MNNWYLPLPLRSFKSQNTIDRAYDVYSNLRNRGRDMGAAIAITQSTLKKEGLDTSRFSKQELEAKEKKERDEQELLKTSTQVAQMPDTPVAQSPKQPVQPRLTGLGMFWDE